MGHKKALLALLLAFSFVAGCAGKKQASSTAPVSDTPPSQQSESDEEQSEPPSQEEEEKAEAAEQPPPVTTLSLCEPIGERWPYPTADERKKTRALIKKTCKAMGVGKEDCKFFYGIISVRESSYRYWVRHKLSGDVAAALSSYLGRSNIYGWSTRWHSKDRKREDLSKVEYKEYGSEQNPYFLDPKRWMFGLGLGGLNISYHLVKFDKMAPPEILCDPVINVMVQITIARNAVTKYKAQNFAEIQAIYAGRTYHDDNGRARPLSCTRGCPKGVDAEQKAKARKGDKGILKRCDAQGLDCYKKPQLGGKVVLKNMTREERYEAAEEIRGEALPPFDTPPDVGLHPVDPGALEG